MKRPPSLSDLELADRRVLIRVDFNVPLDAVPVDGGPVDGGRRQITDDTRIRAALPTIRAVLEAGGRPVLLSHLGRPKGQVVEELRLAPVAERLQEHLSCAVIALGESLGEGVERAVEEAPSGSVVLLENVRFHAAETKGDPGLAAAFARLGDVFVNDAFGTSHRDHASVSGLARALPSAAGMLLEREIEAFQRVLVDPQQPFVAILGGAKVSDKLKVIGNLIERVSSVLVGGGMAYTFLKAQGKAIGDSLCQDEELESLRTTLEKAQTLGVDILLPSDHVVADRFAADATTKIVSGDIPAGRMGLDIGPETRARYVERIAAAGSLVWNGPMGVFEMEAFRAGTETVAKAVAECAGYTVVGGGDSVAAVELFGLGQAIDHISTGGGASLELLEGRELPGITALDARKRS